MRFMVLDFVICLSFFDWQFLVFSRRTRPVEPYFVFVCQFRRVNSSFFIVQVFYNSLIMRNGGFWDKNSLKKRLYWVWKWRKGAYLCSRQTGKQVCRNGGKSSLNSWVWGLWSGLKNKLKKIWKVQIKGIPLQPLSTESILPETVGKKLGRQKGVLKKKIEKTLK